MIHLVAMLIVLLWVIAFIRIWLFRTHFARKRPPPGPSLRRVSRKKPQWVCNEIIRLKAMMPHEGCRTIAAAFNARYTRDRESVGKTYVAETLKRHAARVLELRKTIKLRKRGPSPRNRVWSMDITFVSIDLKPIPILGILDHGTRAILHLRPLADRSTIDILRILLSNIKQFGRLEFMRTDNEPIFNSKLMRLALRFLGIRKQTIDPFCPWQNGRIERIFRTLKERLYPWWQSVGVPEDVQVDLDVFRTWYNHARAHQSLSGLTPAMAWAGITGHRKCPRFFLAWDGLLTGWIPPP